MEKGKVQLVSLRAPGTDCYLGAAFPPFGLLHIASAVLQRFPRCDVEVFDEQVMDKRLIFGRLERGVIGFYVTHGNYVRSLRFAERAKELGAVVVFGGPYATARAPQVLRRRDCVDHVAIGDGIVCMPSLVTGDAPETVENLVSRSPMGHVVSRNRSLRGQFVPVEYEVRSFPNPRFDLVAVEPYFREFRQRFPELGAAALPFLSHKGCALSGGKRCIFCSIPDRSCSRIPPRSFWAKVLMVTRVYKTDLLWDVGDDFTGDANWLHQIAEARPEACAHVRWFVYARPDRLSDPSVISILQHLNVRMVYIGFESGSPTLVSENPKGKWFQSADRLLSQLADCGVCVCASFVLGLRGETRATMEETLNFCSRLKRALGQRLVTVNANPLIPYPGSFAYKALSTVVPEYRDTDWVDQRELVDRWLGMSCRFPWRRTLWLDKIYRYCEWMRALGRSRNVVFSGKACRRGGSPPWLELPAHLTSVR
jgi:radical SAM superfamily enzyme YgiQ (UPF0313 family)